MAGIRFYGLAVSTGRRIMRKFMTLNNNLKQAIFLTEGQSVYISDQYYKDVGADFIEIPRFGWSIKSLLTNVATIEYHRKNIKFNTTLIINVKYLFKDMLPMATLTLLAEG